MAQVEQIASPAERTSEQCRELALAGRAFAFKAVSLFHKRHPTLFRLLGADDALGEALLSVVRASHYFDPACGFAFSTYATRAALLDLMRAARPALRRYRHTVLFSAIGSDERGLPFDPGDNRADPARQAAETEAAREEVKALHAALTRLPDRLRFIVVQYHLHGRSLGEIGEELGLSIERVRVLRGEGEARLRQLLGAEIRGPLPGQRGRRRVQAPPRHRQQTPRHHYSGMRGRATSSRWR
jgi:RNA polymerase sigma factor (sigma-70 family)